MSVKRVKMCCAALALLMILSACSARLVGSETLTATMEALNDTLPTASVKDTTQTQIEVGTHRAVFRALCNQLTDVCAETAQ